MPDVRPSSELIIDTSMFRTAGQPVAASSGNASRQTLTSPSSKLMTTGFAGSSCSAELAAASPLQ